MERSEVKNIIAYYKNIPEMHKLLLKQHRDFCNNFYNSAKAITIDGMPHGTSVSNPSETLGIKAAEASASERLREIEEDIKILESDYNLISACLDRLNSKYKKLICNKYVNKYSWVKISFVMNEPESTCRYRTEFALERLGEQLSRCKNISEISKRAMNARR